MNTKKINLAELIRHIQKLANSTEFTPEILEEYEFYLALFSVFNQAILPGYSENLVNFHLKRCPIEKAQSLAEPLGLHIVEGKNALYLSWAKNLND